MALPYRVTERNYTIQYLGQVIKTCWSFFCPSRGNIDYHYERNTNDPRISHQLTLEVDTKYGNIKKSVSIGYGRKQSPLLGEDKKKQEQILITNTENDITNAIDKPVSDPKYHSDNYRTPLPSEVRTYELTGLLPENGTQRFSFLTNFPKTILLQSLICQKLTMSRLLTILPKANG